MEQHVKGGLNGLDVNLGECSNSLVPCGFQKTLFAKSDKFSDFTPQISKIVMVLGLHLKTCQIVTCKSKADHFHNLIF